jgi:hypothetical protein
MSTATASMSPPSIWMAYAGVACDAMCEVKSMRKVPRQRIVMRGSLKGFFGSPPFICSLDCCAIARAPGRPRVFLLHLCTEAGEKKKGERRARQELRREARRDLPVFGY